MGGLESKTGAWEQAEILARPQCKLTPELIPPPFGSGHNPRRLVSGIFISHGVVRGQFIQLKFGVSSNFILGKNDGNHLDQGREEKSSARFV